MRKYLRKTVILAVLGIAIGAAGCADDEAPDESTGDRDLSALEAQLEIARDVTARYQDAAAAEADGFVPTGECAADASGGMGVHFVHFERFFAEPELERPAGLLYEPTDGGMRLVGVEYFLVVRQDGEPYVAPESEPPRPDALPATAPEVFSGVPFDGPMAGHDPMMPWHYDQHVWVWEPNPSGMFMPFNPNVRCP